MDVFSYLVWGLLSSRRFLLASNAPARTCCLHSHHHHHLLLHPRAVITGGAACTRNIADIARLMGCLETIDICRESAASRTIIVIEISGLLNNLNNNSFTFIFLYLARICPI
jgi:hypothetical protein